MWDRNDIICLFVVGILACALFFYVGKNQGMAQREKESIQRGYGEYQAVDRNTVKFVWKEKE